MQRTEKTVVPRIAGAAALALLALLPPRLCLAGEEQPIVWQSDRHALSGTRTLALHPAVHAEAARAATGIIRNALQDAGIRMVEADGRTPASHTGLHIELVHHAAGSVGGRWVGMGGGAAICIVRAQVLDAASGVPIGDVVVAEQVGAGGLFSIGAGQHVLRAAARRTAEELAKLFGATLPAREETGR